VFNCFSKAEWELKIGFLKLHASYRQLLKNLLRSVHRFLGGFRKAICSSHRTLEQLFELKQEGLGKSVKILKHFERGKIKLVNWIWNKLGKK
jgi:hypothetical protein